MVARTWRSEKEVSIILARHAEAWKNIEDKHGGSGTDLTPGGEAQCAAMAARLLASGIEEADIYSHAIPQVAATAELVHDRTGWRVVGDDALRGIGFGRLAGVSRAEAARRHPDAAARLEAWRGGHLRIDQLRIPGGEDVLTFRARVELVLERILKRRRTAVIVGTRSTFIMLMNLLRMEETFSFGTYVTYEFRNASLTRWEIGARQPVLVYHDEVPFS